LNVRPPLLALIIALVTACTTVPPQSLDPVPDYDPQPSYPHWSGRPVSWSKLGDIEDWLEGSGPSRYPEYVQLAHLELAEGRLDLARREARKLPAAALAVRLDAAETGFQRVLERGDLRPTLRLRAERGLTDITELRAGRPVPVPAGRALPPTAGVLEIFPRGEWRAARTVQHRLTPTSGWNRITVHHSAKDSKEIGTPTSGHVADAIKKIQTVHMRDRGWGDIGYHFLIDPTGRVWQGRLLDWQGAHASGANNIANIGICLLGDFNRERPSPQALEALERLVDALCDRHHIARDRVYGHRKFTATECPGDSLMAWVSAYASGATH